MTPITITIEEITHEGQTVRFDPPFVFRATHRHNKEIVMRATASPWLYAFGESAEKLTKDASKEVAFVYRAFALADPAGLTPAAQKLRREILDRVVKEVQQ